MEVCRRAKARYVKQEMEEREETDDQATHMEQEP